MPDLPGPQQVAVSVSDMARLVGLSRSRFHQLLKEGFFPAPQKCPETGRPFYDHIGQTSCLEVRRTHLGLNGRTVMFYAKRFGRMEDMKPRARPTSLGAQTLFARKRNPSSTSNLPVQPKHAALIDALRQLGLNDLSEQRVSVAIGEAFPQGTQGQPEKSVLLAVFRHLVRRDSGENVGR